MLHNQNGGFDNQQVMACENIQTLLTWRQIAEFDIVRLKNNLQRSKDTYRETNEPDPDYTKRRQAYNIQVSLAKIIDLQIQKIRSSQ